MGQEAAYLRSANEIITIVTQIQGVMGGKPKKLSADDIYPQLSYTSKKTRGANQLVDWDRTEERIQKQLIAAGLFTEEGDPVGYNPHSK